TPFTVLSTSADSVAVAPVFTLPKGWSTVSAVLPSTIAPNAMELWLVSISAPSAAPAGVYVLRAGITAGGATVTDSVVVSVDERHEVQVRAQNAASFVEAGSTYEAKFLVRNRGNVDGRFSVRGSSNRGKMTLDAT